MKYLGIDYGIKRIGVAVGSDETNIAFPRVVLKNKKDIFENIGDIIKKDEIDAVVIGESKNLKGKDNPIMGDIKIFKEKLIEKFKLPVFFHTEVFTSHQAQHIQGKNDMIDASAASIILTSFLEYSKNKKIKIK